MQEKRKRGKTRFQIPHLRSHAPLGKVNIGASPGGLTQPPVAMRAPMDLPAPSSKWPKTEEGLGIRGSGFDPALPYMRPWTSYHFL